MKKLNQNDIDRITSKGGTIKRKVKPIQKKQEKQELSPNITKEIKNAAVDIVNSINDSNAENNTLIIQMYERISILMLKVLESVETSKVSYPKRDFIFDIDRNTNGFIQSIKVKEEEVTKH